MIHECISISFDILSKVILRFRAFIVSIVLGVPLRKCGAGFKIRGAEFIDIGEKFSIGDNCWIEAVRRYAGVKYSPIIRFGNSVSLSDSVHISCVSKIEIGSGVLIGSKVYVGDHSHGSMQDTQIELNLSPADRKLNDICPIWIGDRVWICDGAIILAGSIIASGSVIAANSVVRLQITRPALIAGIPAKVIRFLDNK
jgi:acetyltransferase-like isoleucine patch superfamily enzyme